MLRNIKTFIARISTYLEKHAAIIQTTIALIMLVAVVQSGQTLDLTRRQVESTIEPVLDFSMYSSNLRLTNGGLAKIQKIEQLGLVAGHFDDKSQIISDYSVHFAQSSLTDSLNIGESFIVDLSPYKNFTPSPRQDYEIDVYCLAIRYRRSVDMKPFLKHIQFMTTSFDTATESKYVPLFPSPGVSITVPRSASVLLDSWRSARQELLKLCESNFASEQN